VGRHYLEVQGKSERKEGGMVIKVGKDVRGTALSRLGLECMVKVSMSL